jgi:hypothetical protein
VALVDSGSVFTVALSNSVGSVTSNPATLTVGARSPKPYGHFSSCIKKDANDADGILHQRFIDLLSHGKYSLYEPQEMGDETKDYFQKILYEFLARYPFNPALFPSTPEKAPPS